MSVFSMKTFDVYQHPCLSLEAVKNGFSWPGFFFSWIWAFVKGLPWRGVFILLAGMILVALGETAEVPVALLGLLLCIWVGACGNKWRVESLIERGFIKKKTVVAGSPEGAIAQVLVGNPRPAPLPWSEPVDAPASGERRACPYCAEMILTAARVCRYCSRDVDPLVAEPSL